MAERLVADSTLKAVDLNVLALLLRDAGERSAV
jgi:hypothetical protein